MDKIYKVYNWGTSINFLTRYDIKKMKEIEEYYNTIVEELPANFTL
mgnify:CR=1 FL=1